MKLPSKEDVGKGTLRIVRDISINIVSAIIFIYIAAWLANIFPSFKEASGELATAIVEQVLQNQEIAIELPVQQEGMVWSSAKIPSQSIKANVVIRPRKKEEKPAPLGAPSHEP